MVSAAARLVMVLAVWFKSPPALIWVPTSVMLLVAWRVMLPPALRPEVMAVVLPSVFWLCSFAA